MADQNRSWLGLFLLGALLSIGIIVASVVVAKTVQLVKSQNQRIQVKGFAERTIISDVAVWTGQITNRSPELATAYENLQSDLQKVLSYLKQQGIPDENISTSSIRTTINYQLNSRGVSTNIIDGYTLNQNVKITSPNIDQISEIASGVTGLIKEGVEIDSYPPQYFYTKLDDMKIELLGEATKNASLRAQQLAENSGSKVGVLKYASQGVFQITPLHSTQISNYGTYDTSTIQKSVKAVVTMEYSIR